MFRDMSSCLRLSLEKLRKSYFLRQFLKRVFQSLWFKFPGGNAAQKKYKSKMKTNCYVCAKC